MTIQALAWAIEQQVPGEAKLVLLALANHADHMTGEVRFDATALSRESVVPESSLPRYLGALRRNGFIARADSKDGRRYWLQFDRDPSRAWAWSAEDHQRHEGDDAPATGERRSALVGAAPPPAFRPARQAEAREQVVAAEAARVAEGVPVIEGSKAFEAWCRHFRAQRQITPYVRLIIADGQERRGFMMPTLFPPRENVENVEAAG
jgi:hypothetical protein